jgi:mono/diheme cytochrome c family protein
MKKIILLVIAGVIILFLLIQLVPYGRDHTNPPVVAEPAWDSPQTRALAQRACFDCHSNETVWPWYSNVAPVSWLVQRDTIEGRQKLNFSTWGTGEQETEEMYETVAEGEMPPPVYLITHPEARLTAAEKQALLSGIKATFGVGEGGEGGGDD